MSLLAALFAASVAGRNLLVDRQDRRQSQASQVAGWWGVDPDYIPRKRLPLPPKQGALLRNASELPVYDLQVEFVRADGTSKLSDRQALPPTDSPSFVHPPPEDVIEGYLDRHRRVRRSG